MATVPTFTEGAAVHKADLDFLLSPPRCQVAISSTATNLADSTFTALTWDSSQYDTDSMWSSGSRVNINTTGLWLIHFHILIATAPYTVLSLNLRQNSAGSPSGGTSIFTYQPVGTSATGLSGIVAMSARTAAEVRLSAGDYVEVFARQTSGATRALTLGAHVTGLQARWVGTF